jgi:23S rRNA pseudouridine1911/1915/1917 synthase
VSPLLSNILPHQHPNTRDKLDDSTVPLEGIVPDALAGTRGDAALARMFPQYSRSRIQQWARAGHVAVDGRQVDLDKPVWGGERVRITPQLLAEVAAFKPEEIRLKVVYEDDAMLVIDKPAGMVVHPGSGNWQGTMLNALLHHAPGVQALPRAGIVHRLDKDTSGLLVVAKTLIAQTSLVRQLQARTVKRNYFALVHGHVAADGEVDAPIGRDPHARTRMAVVATGKPARTRYRVVKRFSEAGAFTAIECSLDTGRTHQIRVHLRSIGHALVGDPTYGAKRSELPECLRGLRRQALHAARLGLIHPTTQQSCEWESPLPEDLAQSMARLK